MCDHWKTLLWNSWQICQICSFLGCVSLYFFLWGHILTAAWEQKAVNATRLFTPRGCDFYSMRKAKCAKITFSADKQQEYSINPYSWRPFKYVIIKKSDLKMYLQTVGKAVATLVRHCSHCARVCVCSSGMILECQWNQICWRHSRKKVQVSAEGPLLAIISPNNTPSRLPSPLFMAWYPNEQLCLWDPYSVFFFWLCLFDFLCTGATEEMHRAVKNWQSNGCSPTRAYHLQKQTNLSKKKKQQKLQTNNRSKCVYKMCVAYQVFSVLFSFLPLVGWLSTNAVGAFKTL